MQDRGSPDSVENREVSARVLGLGFMPVVMQRQVPDVERVQKTVESPQLVLLLVKVVDVPVLATSWGCRGSTVAVHRLVVAAHHGYDELMRRLFRAGEGVAGTPGACSQAFSHPN